MINDYETEEQQVEALKEWWQRNGTSIIAGVVLGVGGLLGFRYWQASVAEANEAASAAFYEMRQLAMQGSTDAIVPAAESLLQAHDDSTYATAALLMLAQQAVVDGDHERALQHLQDAQARKPDEALAAIIAMRKARVLVDKGDFDQALAELPQAPGEAFAGMVAEIRGDALLARGDRAAAFTAYEQARDAGSSYSSAEDLELKYYAARPVDMPES